MACHHVGLLLLYGKDGGYEVKQVSADLSGLEVLETYWSTE